MSDEQDLLFRLRSYIGDTHIVRDTHAAADLVEQLQRDLAAMRTALQEIVAIENQYTGADWDEIEKARGIARAAIAKEKGNV